MSDNRKRKAVDDPDVAKGSVPLDTKTLTYHLSVGNSPATMKDDRHFLVPEVEGDIPRRSAVNDCRSSYFSLLLGILKEAKKVVTNETRPGRREDEADAAFSIIDRVIRVYAWQNEIISNGFEQELSDEDKAFLERLGDMCASLGFHVVHKIKEHPDLPACVGGCPDPFSKVDKILEAAPKILDGSIIKHGPPPRSKGTRSTMLCQYETVFSHRGVKPPERPITVTDLARGEAVVFGPGLAGCINVEPTTGFKPSSFGYREDTSGGVEFKIPPDSSYDGALTRLLFHFKLAGDREDEPFVAPVLRLAQAYMDDNRVAIDVLSAWLSLRSIHRADALRYEFCVDEVDLVLAAAKAARGAVVVKLDDLKTHPLYPGAISFVIE